MSENRDNKAVEYVRTCPPGVCKVENGQECVCILPVSTVLKGLEETAKARGLTVQEVLLEDKYLKKKK